MRFNKNKFHPRSYKLKTLSGQPHSKYNVAPVEARTYEGIVFASRGEMNRYIELTWKVKAGEIKDLTLQPHFTLLDDFKDWRGEPYHGIEYVADFQYFELATGRIVIEDFKGYETDVFKIKEKLLRSKYPDMDFRIIV